MCHRIPRFIEKVARAGCNTVYIGLENINPESLMGANKRQNKIWEYRAMLQAWRKAKVMIWAGYILGFPTDTAESIRRDIEIVKKELPIDIMEFMCLTPLPGSEDHKKLYVKGVPMDPDMNKYDVEHVCTAHPRMSKDEWEQAYRDAWATLLFRRACRDRAQARLRERALHEQGEQRADRVRRLRRASRTYTRCSSGWCAARCARSAATACRSRTRWCSIRGAPTTSSRARRRGARSRCAIGGCASASSTIPASRNYIDELLRVTLEGSNRPDEFMEVYADKIPATHGAPKREKASREGRRRIARRSERLAGIRKRCSVT